MSDNTHEMSSPLLALLAHGWGELTEDDGSTTLVLTVPAEQLTLAQIVARLAAIEQPGDTRRYIVREHRLVSVHLYRRQDKTPA
jgi:hypothetical protein